LNDKCVEQEIPHASSAQQSIHPAADIKDQSTWQTRMINESNEHSGEQRDSKQINHQHSNQISNINKHSKHNHQSWIKQRYRHSLMQQFKLQHNSYMHK
jgi:hypothetical protein